MGPTLDIACLQTRPMPDFDSALAEALPLAEQAVAAGAKFLALPEYCGGLTSEGSRIAPPAAAEEAHPVLAALRAFARTKKVWMLIGSVAIAAKAGRILNRGFLVDDRGVIRARYDKIHMFDVQLSETEVFCESETVVPGSEAVLAVTPWGRMGLTICYDLRFPALYRDLAQSGAGIIFVPAAFTRRTGEAHWIVLNRARAIENGCFIVSPCATGKVPGGGACFGHSLVVDPWGQVLVDAGTAPCMVRATLDLARVGETRGRIPSLDHDRAYSRSSTVERNAA